MELGRIFLEFDMVGVPRAILFCTPRHRAVLHSLRRPDHRPWLRRLPRRQWQQHRLQQSSIHERRPIRRGAERVENLEFFSACRSATDNLHLHA